MADMVAPALFAGDIELAALAERLRVGTVHVGAARGGGTGIVWDDGQIVTNAHVADSGTVRVTLADGDVVAGRVVASDPWRDLAAIRVGRPLAPLPRAAAVHARAGALTIAYGHPLGWTHALAFGVLHHVERIGRTGPPRWIRADVRLHPGNSGGPLVDAAGCVLGVNAMVARGTALAIPAEAVEAFLDAGRPRLGVALRPARLRTRAGDRFVLFVLGLEPDGAAERAGIVPGDALLEINGLPVEAASDIGQILHVLPAGDTTVRLVRAGRTLTRAVAVARAETKAA